MDLPPRLTAVMIQLTRLLFTFPLPSAMLVTLDDGVWSFLRSWSPPSFGVEFSSSAPASVVGKGRGQRGMGVKGGEEEISSSSSTISTFLYQSVMDVRVVGNDDNSLS